MRNAKCSSFTKWAISAVLIIGLAACGGSGSDGGGTNNPPPPPSDGGGGGGGGGGGSDARVTVMVQPEGYNLMEPQDVCVKAGFTAGQKTRLDCDDNGCLGGPFTATPGNVAIDIFDRDCSAEVPLWTSQDGGAYVEVNDSAVQWGQQGTLLWLFGLDGSGNVGQPSGAHDSLDGIAPLIRAEITMHYHGPTGRTARNPMRMVSNITRWATDVEVQQTAGDDYAYHTWVRPGVVRKIVWREKTPGQVPGQENGRDAGYWEVNTMINGCDITASNDNGATMLFMFAAGDDRPRTPSGNLICN